MKWGYCAQAKLNELYRQDYMKWWNMKQKNMSFLEYFQTVWNLQLSARHNATFLIILFSLGFFFCPFLLIFQINCKNAKLFPRKYFCMNLIYFSRLVWIVHERLNCFLSYLVFCQDFLISWNDSFYHFMKLKNLDRKQEFNKNFGTAPWTIYIPFLKRNWKHALNFYQPLL